MLDTLRADFARLPELLALEPPPQPEPAEFEPVVPEPELAVEIEPVAEAAEPAVERPAPAPDAAVPERAEPAEAQLGLF
jgi:hypothetical protein